MDNMSFTEEDKKKFIDYLNMVAKHAKFNLDTQELISYFKLLSFVQQTIVPKIDSNIFEVKKVTSAKEE